MLQDRFKFKVLDTIENKLYSSLEDLSKEEPNAHFLLTQDGEIIKKYYNNGEIQLIRMSQYKPIFCTGLKDKNGIDLLFEYDIINKNGIKIGNYYENKNLLKEPINFIIKGMGTKEWRSSEQEAIKRGCYYAE